MATTKATLLGHRSATSFSDLTLSGDLTVNGTTTTLDTAVQNVDKLEIGASSTDYGAKINQASTGNILQLQDNGTDVMVVEDGGNIGIRTSNPGVTLDIHDANPAIDLYDTGTNGYCRIDANGANLTLHADKGGNGSSSTIKFGVDNSVKMTIDSSGNVGIGGSPTEHLSIEGSGSQSLSIYSTDTGSVETEKTFIKMFGENTAGDKREQARISASPGHSASNAGQLIFSTNNSSNVMTQRMIIREDGNVGIGASPAQTLHVKTSSSATPITFGVLSNATGLPAISLNGAYASTAMAGIYGNGATSSNLYYTVPSGRDHIFSIADVSKMVIDDSGKVGIGTTSPDTLLEVNAGAAACITTDRSNSGAHIQFDSNGSEKGSISESGGTVSYNPFTGSHYGWIDGSCELGKVLIMTGANQHAYNDATQEIIYGIEECSTENDSRFLGTYLSVMNPDNDRTIGDSDNSANPDLVMAVGNGKMWVVDEGLNITQGDHLITSSTQGHARKDPQTATYSHIIGRAGEPIDWSEVSETVGGKKHKLISILFDICTVKN